MLQAMPCHVMVVSLSASVPCPSVVAFAPGHDTKLYRDPIHAARALRAVSRARLAVSQRCIAALLRYIPTQRSPLNQDTISVLRLPLARPCARAGRQYRGLSRPYRGACSAVSWLSLGPYSCTHPSYVTIQFTVSWPSTNYKWVVAQPSFPCKFFFFHHFIPPTRRPQKKKIYIYIYTYLFIYSFSNLPCYFQRCSSLNTAIYPIQNFQEFNYKLFFLCKNWNNFQNSTKPNLFMFKTGNAVQKFFFFFSFISGPFCPKILKQLFLKLNPKVLFSQP